MKLKKLEWQKTIDGDYEAEALGGFYVIEQDLWTVKREFVGIDNVRASQYVINQKKGHRLYDDIEKAMDAAQLDFERMVCECYEYPEQAEAAHG